MVRSPLPAPGPGLRATPDGHALARRAAGVGCELHDASGSYCSSANAPAWCELRFCWVDPNLCDQLDVAPSAWFPGKAHYSYGTCGDIDIYSGFYTHLNATTRTARLVPPLVSATSCMDLVAPQDSCGPLSMRQRLEPQ